MVLANFISLILTMITDVDVDFLCSQLYYKGNYKSNMLTFAFTNRKSFLVSQESARALFVAFFTFTYVAVVLIFLIAEFTFLVTTFNRRTLYWAGSFTYANFLAIWVNFTGTTFGTVFYIMNKKQNTDFRNTITKNV